MGLTQSHEFIKIREFSPAGGRGEIRDIQSMKRIWCKRDILLLALKLDGVEGKGPGNGLQQLTANPHMTTSKKRLVSEM